MLLRSGPRFRFLVSACNVRGALYRVEIRGESSRVKKLDEGPTTGLGRSASGQIYVGRPDSIALLDQRLRPLDQQFGTKVGSDLHDVKAMDDGAYAVVETSHNRVVGYERSGQEAWSWSPTGGDGDLCHVNSILLGADGWLASMFTPEGLGEPWRERLDGAVMSFDLATPVGGRIIRRGLQHPHSMCQVDGDIWICESKQRRIVRFDPAGAHGPLGVVAEIDGYARGLCVTSDWVFVGQSRSDKGRSFVNPLMGSGAPLISGRCGIWAIRRDSRSRFFVELPSNEVYDIVALP